MQTMQELRFREDIRAAIDKAGRAKRGAPLAEVVAELEKLDTFAPPDREDLAPLRAEIHFTLGQCYQRDSGTRAKAETAFRMALLFNPSHVKCLVALGNLLSDRGQTSHALWHFDRALDIDRFYIPAMTSAGNMLAKQGRDKKALEYLEKALVIEPQNAIAWTTKGSLMSKNGEYQQALKCYERALATEPDNPVTLVSAAHILTIIGKNEEALIALNHALEVTPRHLPAWNAKGGLLAQLGRNEEAVSCYNKALEIDSRNAAAGTAKSLSLIFLKQTGNALENLKTVILQEEEKSGKTSPLRYLAGRLCFDNGDSKQAMFWMMPLIQTKNKLAAAYILASAGDGHPLRAVLKTALNDDEFTAIQDKAHTLRPDPAGLASEIAALQKSSCLPPEAVKQWFYRGYNLAK